jgi:hypothetical protein
LLFDVTHLARERGVANAIERQCGCVRHDRKNIFGVDVAGVPRIERDFAQFTARGETVTA